MKMACEKPGMEPLYSLSSAANHPAIWADRSLSHLIVLIAGHLDPILLVWWV